MNRRRCDFLDDFYRWWLNNVIYAHMHRLRCRILFLPFSSSVMPNVPMLLPDNQVLSFFSGRLGVGLFPY